jgi:poly-gamma-glutamate synthesis protein (capsule biosynthesis protein)
MPLTLFAVGDLMLGDQPLCENFGVKAVLRAKGTGYLFREITPLLRQGDIVFGNLECSLAIDDADLLPGSSFFCTDGAAAAGLREAGFTVLSVANNHIMENGRERFSETLGAVQEQGIAAVGVRGEIPVLVVRGRRVAFLAYSFIEDGIADPCYNRVQSEGPIIDDLLRVRPEAEIVVVSLHWGSEYVPFPSPEQVRIGRALVDAGADIILGTHPHVSQSFEMYRDRPILYSLGNCVFDATFIGETRDSFIAKITIGDSADRFDVGLIPIRIDRRDYSPALVESYDRDRMLAQADTTRSMIEGSVVSVYEERVGDYDRHYRRYKRPALRSMKRHFILSIPRYSPTTFYRIARAYAARRVGDQR